MAGPGTCSGRKGDDDDNDVNDDDDDADDDDHMMMTMMMMTTRMTREMIRHRAPKARSGVSLTSLTLRGQWF